jgi:hypothetical protein
MKKQAITLFFFLLALGMTAQTKDNKLGITAGGGSQKFNGDLGNAFKVNNICWYGGVTINAAYYLNASFDAGIFGFMGDLGFTQPDGIASKEISADDRCPGCIGRIGLGNLNGRMTSGGVLVKYKFYNNYLLKANAVLRPYVYFGASFNNVVDRMRMGCVNPGNYYSINSGAGVSYYFTERININYNFTLGYFTSDKIDFMSHGRNDMYMQNTLSLGVDLF